MILVDTSIWIDHLHQVDDELVRLLAAGLGAAHPMVTGELAMGSMRDRDTVLALVGALPRVVEATHDEVLRLVEGRRLFGRGLSIVDGHLLCSAVLTPGARLWTRDRRLAGTAADLGVAYAAQ